jgi:dihydrofolate synthase/folylpolyglutamate synthase
VVEVGLGGKFDATNVVRPAACAITSISMDHQDFLGDTLGVIAAEKAGIIKPGVPVVVGAQEPEAMAAILGAAEAAGVPVLLRGRDWEIAATAEGLRFEGLELPPPGLPGVHQAENAAIAMMALRAAGFELVPEVLAAGLRAVEWPARLQRLRGALLGLLPAGSELWLDGAHNPGGAEALAAQLQDWAGPTALVLGMKQAKDVGEVMRILMPHAAQIFAVAEPGQHLALPVEAIVEASGGRAVVGPDVRGALGQIAAPTRVLICGSLYLAGEVLKLDAGDVAA